MKKSEVLLIHAALMIAYPKLAEPDEATIEMWHRALTDVDYKVAEVAVQKLILESTFPPSIAEVRAAITEITQPAIPTPAEAWGEVEKAMRLYGYYREKEALSSMSEITRQTVKCMGWADICMSEKPSVTRGQFLKMYEQIANRRRSESLLPQPLKDEIRKLSERYSARLIEGKGVEKDPWSGANEEKDNFGRRLQGDDIGRGL
jgi:hypothetical protein